MFETVRLFPPELATPELIARYLGLVFVASVGVIQVGAAAGDIKGLLFLPSPRLCKALGMGLVLLAFAWFFSWHFGPDNPQARGLEGGEQTLLFLPGAGAALLFTLLVSSLVHLLTRGARRVVDRRDGRGRRPVDGLEALQEMSYVEAAGSRWAGGR